jgi:C4-dicarboxylate-specific signal transduction histidine kinase
MQLRRLSIRATLWAGLVLITVVMSLLAVSGHYTAVEMERFVRSLSREQLTVAETLSATNAALRASNYALLRSMLQEGLQPRATPEDTPELQAAIRQIDVAATLTSLPESTRTLLTRVRTALDAAGAQHAEVVRLFNTGARAAAVTEFQNRLRPELDRIESAMLELRAAREAMLRDSVDRAAQQVARTSRRLQVLAGAAILGTAAAVYLLVRRISIGVAGVVDAAHEVARDVLHQELPPLRAADELTYLRDHIAATRTVLESSLAERDAHQNHVRALETQLAHAARVSTLGEMASGLAHELNQPLAAIAGYAHACLERLNNPACRPEDLRATLQKSVDQSRRAGAIIQYIRGFIRREPEPRTALDVNEVVREALTFLEHEVSRRHAEVRLQLHQQPLWVWANRIELQQVLVNLVQNALEAMSELPAPVITIRTDRDADGAVAVSVQDCGPGFAPGVREQLFRPFFTTKSDGIGLGLALSRTIVEAHGGRLCAESDPTTGAVFRFCFPAHGVSCAVVR